MMMLIRTMMLTMMKMVMMMMMMMLMMMMMMMIASYSSSAHRSGLYMLSVRPQCASHAVEAHWVVPSGFTRDDGSKHH
eukprot:6433580-Pyramimonas_sp.AAC.1